MEQEFEEILFMPTVNFGLLGIRMRNKRKKLHITQMDLAETTNLSVPYISLVENGRKKPSLDAILKISEALDLSLDYLLLGIESKESHLHQSDLSNLLSENPSDVQKLLLDFLQATREILAEYEHKASE